MRDTLGGYRLLRTVGLGSRAEVFLAHPLRAGADGPPAVLKVYGESVTDESVYAEVEALSRAEGDHVVGVLDVTSTPGGAPALVLTRHAAGSLARLLGDRPSLAAGEAITILAPLTAAIARMHAAGVAHGAIGPGAVLFDAAGSPALGCFGRAVLFAPGLSAAALVVEQAVLADVLAFGALAATVLERAGASPLARYARTEAAPGAWLADFCDRLFEVAEPLAVDLQPREAELTLPSRVIELAPAYAFEPEPVQPRPAGPRLAKPRLAEPGWRDRVVGQLARVRRPVWIVAGASLLALVVALVAVPREGTTAAQPSQTPSPVHLDTGPVMADDPLAALVVLFAAREQCIRDLDARCLEQVDQRDSSALDADRASVQEVLDGGVATLPSADDAELVQRLGDSALISLGADSVSGAQRKPASVLLVKGEAGWRIRDYLEE